MKRMRLIALEGPKGCGKSTLATHMATLLNSAAVDLPGAFASFKHRVPQGADCVQRAASFMLDRLRFIEGLPDGDVTVLTDRWVTSNDCFAWCLGQSGLYSPKVNVRSIVLAELDALDRLAPETKTCVLVLDRPDEELDAVARERSIMGGVVYPPDEANSRAYYRGIATDRRGDFQSGSTGYTYLSLATNEYDSPRRLATAATAKALDALSIPHRLRP